MEPSAPGRPLPAATEQSSPGESACGSPSAEPMSTAANLVTSLLNLCKSKVWLTSCCLGSRGRLENVASCLSLSLSLPPHCQYRDAVEQVAAGISLSLWQKKKVALKAQENLLLLATVDHQAAAEALARSCALGPLLADHLCTLFRAIPPTVSPADVATLQNVSWR